MPLKAKRKAAGHKSNGLTAEIFGFGSYNKCRRSFKACLTKAPTESAPVAITDIVARNVQIIAFQLHLANSLKLG